MPRAPELRICPTLNLIHGSHHRRIFASGTNPAEQSSSFAVTYEIVIQSSKRGRPKLIDNQGYCYSIQRQRGVVTDWQCSVRSKVNPCRATVSQLLKSTLHPVDSLLSRQHCITFDIARYMPKTARLGDTTYIKVMTNAMPLCLYEYFNKVCCYLPAGNWVIQLTSVCIETTFKLYRNDFYRNDFVSKRL